MNILMFRILGEELRQHNSRRFQEGNFLEIGITDIIELRWEGYISGEHQFGSFAVDVEFLRDEVGVIGKIFGAAKIEGIEESNFGG